MGVMWGYTGMMEKKRETTIEGLGFQFQRRPSPSWRPPFERSIFTQGALQASSQRFCGPRLLVYLWYRTIGYFKQTSS